MTELDVAIIDYGLGNLQSVQRAFSHVGIASKITSDQEEILNAAGVVLPGVGAFADGMAGLISKNLRATVEKCAASGRPFLGICLGMQMLFESADEFGTHAGLGIISGKVQLLEPTGSDGARHKIPHIGWAALVRPTEQPLMSWKTSLLSETAEQEHMYFVHSYTAYPADSATRLADAWYNGRRIAAVVCKGNVYGCQFHPEKSGEAGLRIIKNFGQLCGCSAKITAVNREGSKASRGQNISQSKV